MEQKSEHAMIVIVTKGVYIVGDHEAIIKDHIQKLFLTNY